MGPCAFLLPVPSAIQKKAEVNWGGECQDGAPLPPPPLPPPLCRLTSPRQHTTEKHCCYLSPPLTGSNLVSSAGYQASSQLQCSTVWVTPRVGVPGHRAGGAYRAPAVCTTLGRLWRAGDLPPGLCDPQTHTSAGTRERSWGPSWACGPGSTATILEGDQKHCRGTWGLEGRQGRGTERRRLGGLSAPGARGAGDTVRTGQLVSQGWPVVPFGGGL